MFLPRFDRDHLPLDGNNDSDVEIVQNLLDQKERSDQLLRDSMRQTKAEKRMVFLRKALENREKVEWSLREHFSRKV